ncbi:unnamed protein product [Thelazia callipaeda]|uniref:Uncharacterized protein n=1 Tax=Thelazia callipaeda TaxID=103827 RepID=A0A0N5CNX1_THECL|nr:unnamed protein product [Thelazia callipaeda]
MDRCSTTGCEAAQHATAVREAAVARAVPTVVAAVRTEELNRGHLSSFPLYPLTPPQRVLKRRVSSVFFCTYPPSLFLSSICFASLLLTLVTKEKEKESLCLPFLSFISAFQTLTSCQAFSLLITYRTRANENVHLELPNMYLLKGNQGF